MPFTFFTQSSYLSRRLLISILLVSSVITLLLTAIQLYFDFKHDIAEVEKQLSQVERGFLDSIAESVWDMDMRRLKTQLHGLNKLPDIHELRVISPAKQVIMAVGEKPNARMVQYTLTLEISKNNRQEYLGSLEMISSYQRAYAHLKEQIIIILLSQGIKTFLISLFILFIVNHLIMRHLVAMAAYAKELNTKNLGKALKLNTHPDPEKDELTQVASAINSMRENFLADISRRKKVEQELEHLHSYLQNIFDSIPSALVAINTDCTVAQLNDQAENLTGMDAKEAKGVYVTEILPTLSRELETIKAIFGDRQVKKDIQLTSQKDGKTCYFDVTLFPLVKNGVAGAVIRIDDVTDNFEFAQEKARFEDKLRQAQKMEAIGTLAGGIAHDFNNILTAILGYAELVLRVIPKDNIQASEFQEEVIRASNRAKELVKQILAFSRQSEQERIPLQVDYIVKEVLKLLRPTIPATINIKSNIVPSCGTIVADPTQIHQLIMNLCTNAYYAMRESGGEMAVSVSSVTIASGDHKVASMELTPGSYIKLEVSDTGVGMDRTVLARIFEPYYTTKKKGEGTGMGLAVVHGIVKSMQGHITAYSEPGKGSTFQVYLPRVDTENILDNQLQTESVGGGNESILIVDDQPEIVRMLENMLQTLGYRVQGYASSTEACEAVLANPEKFDLVVTDMTMPDMTGAEVAQQVLKVRPDMPIVLCTGFSELIDGDKAKALGIGAFLMKPVGINDLGRVIRDLLDEKK